MSRQSEYTLENDFLDQLQQLGYERVQVNDQDGVVQLLRAQLGRLNQLTFSDREFTAVLNHLSKGNIFQRAKILRDRFYLERDNGEPTYVQFLDMDDWSKNQFQVTHQITNEGSYKTRYDVTILVNGLPLVQIELKRRGLEIKEAFNQVNRYQRISYWANQGLFQFVQLFIISNGVNTKYYANQRKNSFQYTFYWADEQNRNITRLADFAKHFLTPDHLHRMISKYMVLNETYKMLMVLRPYQYYAVEAIIDKVQSISNEDIREMGVERNGYIWHTTGSGKTLTSFKASQIVMHMPEVYKVVFVVDRKDLDYQTATEFNAYKKGSVDMTTNTNSLVNQLVDDSGLVVTTIQKLNNAIRNSRYETRIRRLQDKRIVFIFDECHRSQFGETHQRITAYFPLAQLFGFTGTPIFAENAMSNDLGKRTTQDLFGKRLHSYVITDAIRDQNVLKFAIEYIGRYRHKVRSFVDIEVEDIDRREVLDDPARLEKIVDYIIANHDRKTHNRKYTAIFATSSIPNLIKYYEIFRRKRRAGEHDLKVVTTFSYYQNEEDSDATGMIPEHITLAAAGVKPDYQSKHSREKLDEFIFDYNELYGTRFSTGDSASMENYYKDISKRIKDREKEGFNDKNRVDILLVVNMFLTGFDAKMVNTMYVDKNLRYHGLIQAYSRTNRIINEQKSQGNILCFRNLKDNTDEAIKLFANIEAKEEIILPPYEEILRKFNEAFIELIRLVPTPDSVNDLRDENEELAFVQAFRKLIRLHNVLKTHVEFTWDDVHMKEQMFEDYKSKYHDLYDKVRMDRQKEKVSVLQEIDFELELIHRDEINVAYILRLIAKLKGADDDQSGKIREQIVNILGSEATLRSKRELIQKFIDEQLPKIQHADDVIESFDHYWQDQKLLALNTICNEEHLDRKQFQRLIDTYVFNGHVPLKEDVFECLENRPSILKAREIGSRIIERMRRFIEVFVEGVA